MRRIYTVLRHLLIATLGDKPLPSDVEASPPPLGLEWVEDILAFTGFDSEVREAIRRYYNQAPSPGLAELGISLD